MSDVTRILSQIERGEPRAAEELLPLVYDELRNLHATATAFGPDIAVPPTHAKSALTAIEIYVDLKDQCQGRPARQRVLRRPSAG